MVSLLTGKPVRNDVAMTGEITLRGLVLPVGGIKEKFLAAHRAGIKRVIMPERNRKDMIDIPEQPKKEIEILFVKRMDEVLPLALTEMPRLQGSMSTVVAPPSSPIAAAGRLATASAPASLTDSPSPRPRGGASSRGLSPVFSLHGRLTLPGGWLRSPHGHEFWRSGDAVDAGAPEASEPGRRGEPQPWERSSESTSAPPTPSSRSWRARSPRSSPTRRAAG